MFSAKEYFDRGVAKYEQGDLPGAIADYDEAIKLKPDFAEAWINRSNAKQDQGDLDLQGAITDCDEAIKLKPNWAVSWCNRGVIKYEQGDLLGAIADYDKAIEYKFNYAEAWYNRGNAKRAQGDLPGAIADYDKAIEYKFNYAEAWNNRGNAKEDQGNLPGAIYDYGEAIKLKSDYAEAWYNRGNAKVKQGELPGAIYDYGEAINRQPAWCVKVWNNCGIAKRTHGDLQGAIADCGEAIKLKPDLAEAWNNRGNAKQAHGDLQGAIYDYDNAIKLKLDYAEALNNRGVAKEDQGDLPGAIADYDAAIKLDLNLSEAWINCSVVRDAIRERVEPKKIWSIFNTVRSAIEALLKALKEDEKQFEYPMHYTNLDTLLNLAEGGKFRLYDAKSMDDREEGNALFDLFDVDEKQREKIRDTFSAKRSEDLEVFIGSFTTDSNSDYDDDHSDLMWSKFGNHRGEERAGCALIFDKKQLFPDIPLPLTKLLRARLLDTHLENFARKKQDEIVTEKECYLYPVCYKSTKETTDIQCKVNDLYKALKLCDKKYEKTCEMVAVLLNHVRHLFKHETYQNEKEHRLTILRARKSSAVKEDPPVKEDSPRTYVECSLYMKEVTVLLGPKTKKAEAWKQWLKDKDSFKEIETADK